MLIKIYQNQKVSPAARLEAGLQTPQGCLKNTQPLTTAGKRR
jgi:hypothetical protein